MDTIRAATLADVSLMSRNVRTGVESFLAWAPHWHIPDHLGSEGEVAACWDRPDFSAWVNADVSAHSGAFRADDEPDAFHLFNLFAQPEQRGTGIAAALLERQVEDARNAGGKRMRLRTPAGNARGIRFYEREGWHVHGELLTDTPLGLDHLWMRRDL